MTNRRREPSLRKHATGQYFVRIKGKDHYLGRDHDVAESARLSLLLRIKKHGTIAPAGQVVGDETVAVLIARYLRERATPYYRRPDGSPTSEVGNVKVAIQPLSRLLGAERIANISAESIESVRDAMADHSWKTDDERKNSNRTGWSLHFINQNLGRIKRVFRWGFKKKLVPAAVWAEINEVDGLPEGRGYARETADVLPAPQWAIDAVIPALPPCPRAMCELMLATGMRPGEARKLRPADIDRTGERLRLLMGGVNPSLAGCWVYLPGSSVGDGRTDHKTAHHGRRRSRVHRIVPIPPAAQAILEYWLNGIGPNSYVFTPRRSCELLKKHKRATRKSKVQPSQRSRAKRNARRRPGFGIYTRNAFAAAVRRTIERLNRERKKEKKELIPHWHPHVLRHNVATALEAKFGYEVARMVLGHRSIQTTKIYAKGNLEAAFKAMASAG